MSSLKSWALAGVTAIALFPALASAADLRGAPPPAPLPVIEPVEIGGGWYLRGDIGASINGIGSFELPSLNAIPDTIYRGETIGDSFFIGGGIGYQFDWFRFDVTGEYRSTAEWSFVDRFNMVAGPPPAANSNIVSGRFSSAVVMANAYVDLGTWYGITPYIGAGIGAAYNRITGVTDVGLDVSSGGGGYAEAAGKWNLAWAIHAGLAYSVTQNFKVELGYRYINLGEAESGVFRCVPAFTCGIPGVRVHDIDSHDIKIGMRWHLAAERPVAPVYTPPAIVKP